jgi:hypothetical protein
VDLVAYLIQVNQQGLKGVRNLFPLFEDTDARTWGENRFLTPLLLASGLQRPGAKKGS